MGKKFLVSFILAGFVAASCGVVFVLSVLHRPSEVIQSKMLIHVKEGDTFSSIGRELTKKNMISSYLVFRLYGRLAGKDSAFTNW